MVPKDDTPIEIDDLFTFITGYIQWTWMIRGGYHYDFRKAPYGCVWHMLKYACRLHMISAGCPGCDFAARSDLLLDGQLHLSQHRRSTQHRSSGTHDARVGNTYSTYTKWVSISTCHEMGKRHDTNPLMLTKSHEPPGTNPLLSPITWSSVGWSSPGPGFLRGPCGTSAAISDGTRKCLPRMFVVL